MSTKNNYSTTIECDNKCMTRPCLSIPFIEKLGCYNVSELFVQDCVFPAAQNDDTHITVLKRPTVSNDYFIVQISVMRVDLCAHKT